MTKCDGDGSDCHNDDDDDGDVEGDDNDDGDYWLFFSPENPEVIVLKRKYK